MRSPPSGDAVPLRQPPAVPDYELLRRIGSGSYGEVWLARNVLGQFRAVKFVYRSRFNDSRPFEREFEGIQRFEPISRSHPSQLHILHVGKNDDEGCFYYVMELADAAETRGTSESVISNQCPVADQSIPAALESKRPGAKTGSLNTDLQITDYSPRTLRSDLARHGRLPPADCVQIGLSLATALAHLHEQGLVHRDIKPSNVIFVNGVAKLGDIGLVTDAGDTQSIVGTEGYLPPEGPGTTQADLYSLGKVLYEISTGMDRRRYAELPKDLPAWPDREAVFEFNEIVLKACAKDSSLRYASSADLRADLELLTRGKSVKRARARWRLRSLAGKTALIVTVLALLLAIVLPRLSRQRQDAYADGPPSSNDLANALCAKGLHIIRGDNYPSIAEAYTNFHRAIQLDPCFARPYVGLFELRPWEEVPGLPLLSLDEMRGIARKLTDLAPKLAVTYSARSFVAWCELDYVKAREYGLRAIEADPDSALVHAMYGFMLNLWGWPVEARNEVEVARRLAPSKVSLYRLLAHTYYLERNFPKAIAVYREALTWERHHVRAYDCIAEASRAMGDYMTAISNDEQIAIVLGIHNADAKAWFDELRQAFTEQGPLGYWRKQESRYAMESDAHFYDRAICQMHLGKTNAALALLNRSYETHETSGGSSTPRIYVLLFDEVWDGVHDEPRFKELLDNIGFTKVNPKLKK